MKAAEAQDKVIDMMDDAGMLSMPQLIAHVKKSVAMDHVIASQMRAQNVWKVLGTGNEKRGGGRSFILFIYIFFLEGEWDICEQLHVHV